MVKKSSSRKITPMLKKESNEDNKVVTPIANQRKEAINQTRPQLNKTIKDENVNVLSNSVSTSQISHTIDHTDTFFSAQKTNGMISIGQLNDEGGEGSNSTKHVLGDAHKLEFFGMGYKPTFDVKEKDQVNTASKNQGEDEVDKQLDKIMLQRNATEDTSK